MEAYSVDSFCLQHPDGTAVRGWHYSAKAPGKRPAIILSHGFNGCCADLLNRGEAFAGAGIDCFLFDFRGGGLRTTSDGNISEMMTLATECADLSLVADYARSQATTDAGALFLMGESQGGLISTLTATKQPDGFRGLLLWFPALMIPEAARQRLAKKQTEVFGIRLSPAFDAQAATVDPWRAMPDYPGPALLFHGDSDPIVPLEVSQKACQLFPYAKLHVIPGAGHGFGGDDFRFALQASIAMVKETAHAGA